ncbi:hypothetical protein WR25_14983 [Diploscapter pachys]|uniref:R3H-associated N-terminal domain-containing protein n=1 Tax=Diploscapter pachys TaxID=2018661 RepID=A0A2A2L2X4_9BILA|nr:hypothetical protein WR25_14983 [Diploscapter pachys]
MGVTPRRQREDDDLRPIRITDDINYNDYVFTDSEDEEPNQENGENKEMNEAEKNKISTQKAKRSKEGRAQRKIVRLFEEMETGGIRIKRNMGARKWRRVENARLLMSYTDKDDVCDDFSDLVPRQTSAFEQLFLERENMMIWNEFVEKDEAEQSRILNEGHWKEEKQAARAAGDGWFILGGKITTPRKALKEKERDGRKHHPAYSARACFERLDARAKKLLSGKSVNWPFVDFIEDQLRVFFSSADKDGVYLGRFPVASDRALGHAVAQYLWLNSKSVTETTNNERIMEFRNPRAFFIPPRHRLIPYLEAKHNKTIDFVPYSAREELKQEEDGPSCSITTAGDDHNTSMSSIEEITEDVIRQLSIK